MSTSEENQARVSILDGDFGWTSVGRRIVGRNGIHIWRFGVVMLLAYLVRIAFADLARAQPFNDDFARRLSFSSTNITLNASTVGATKQAGEPDHAGNTGGASIWYSWTAPASGLVTLETSGSSFNTLLAIYIGGSLDRLELVVADDEGGAGGTSAVSFNAVKSQNYRIAVDGFQGATGDVVLSLSLRAGSFAYAENPRQGWFLTDGDVLDIVETNGVIYLGGIFSEVGAAPGVQEVSSAGKVNADFPAVVGVVAQVVPDGQGGWYLAGAFSSVGNVQRTNLARILPDQSVDPDWAPRTDELVCALEVLDEVIYIGGFFTMVNGQSHAGLAMLDRATGEVLSWNPGADSGVCALTHADGVLYAGGLFTQLGGLPRAYLAAVDVVTGGVTDWNPGADNRVRALLIDPVRNVIYAGGDFTSAGGIVRSRLAALDLATGNAASWNPAPNARVATLDLKCDTLYVGGLFTTIGGTGRSAIAAVDTVTGAATSWNPDADRAVTDLTIVGNVVYVGGSFTRIGGQPRAQLAALDIDSGLATDWNPGGQDEVTDIGVWQGRILVGFFNSGVKRNNLAAVDAATGRVLPWNPSPNHWVYSLAVHGDRLYVSGVFTQIGGAERRGLAALDTGTGLATAWDPRPRIGSIDGVVNNTLTVRGNTLYVGGYFDQIAGQPRKSLASFDLPSGILTLWNPAADVHPESPWTVGEVFSLAFAGQTVYVGGKFLAVGLENRMNLAAVHAVSGVVLPWNPQANAGIQALAVANDTVLASGFFSEVGGAPRNYLAALDGTTGTALPWDPNPDDRVIVMETQGDTLYTGGIFTSIAGQMRRSLAEFNITTGQLTDWNPRIKGTVFGLHISPTTLYAFGRFFTVNGQIEFPYADFPRQGAPRFRQQPVEQVLPAGSELVLSARASGQYPLAYQWHFNGAPLRNAIEPDLYIPNSQTAHSGVYSVSISNGLGVAYSRQVVVTVFEPPAIVAQPLGQSVSPGTQVNLTVLATGLPPPEYQWRLNGVNLPGAIGPTLVLSNAQPTNGGTYSVVAVNAGGIARSELAVIEIISPLLPLSDNLAERNVVTGPMGQGSGSNTGATREPDEPYHVGKLGTHSVWLGWVAPSNGIATFSTRGSSFDTLLAVYTHGAELTLVAADEDRGGFLTSLVRFNAQAGVEYLIAIDGFAGATGNLVLSWELDTSTVPFPRLLTHPRSQSLAPGADAAFAVTVNTATAETYQWLFGCLAIPGATNATLVIQNVQAADVGEYRVLVMNASSQVAESFPAALEIGPQFDIYSRDKLEDLFRLPGAVGGVLPGNGKAAGAGLTAGSGAGFFAISVAAGNINFQLLSNEDATRSVDEAEHCGVLGGASKWLALTAEADSQMRINTVGSTIDTVVAVYELVGLEAVLVACDNDSAADGIRSEVSFPTRQDHTYFVAMDGVNGVEGNISLNWGLGRPPIVRNPLIHPRVAPGGNLTLRAEVLSDFLAPSLQWLLNEEPVAGATNVVMSLENLQAAQTGLYSVIVSNYAGVVLRPIASVRLAMNTITGFELTSEKRFRIRGQADHGIVLEATSDFIEWIPVYTNPVPGTPFEYLDRRAGDYPLRYYQTRPWPPDDPR